MGVSLPYRPTGYDELVAYYGDLRQYLTRLDAWERQILRTVELRQAIPLAMGQTTRRIRLHHLIVQHAAACLEECARLAAAQDIDPVRWAYAGGYVVRPQRSGARLSTHAWGIAVDLGPARNRYGHAWDAQTGLPASMIDVWRAAGWIWGGEWSRPDPMHFQYVARY